MHQGAGTGEHIDLWSTCAQQKTPLALILLLVCPAPTVGEYKQDALMSAHKSPHVALWPPALARVPPPGAPVLTSSNSSEAGAKFVYVRVLGGLGSFCILVCFKGNRDR